MTSLVVVVGVPVAAEGHLQRSAPGLFPAAQTAAAVAPPAFRQSHTHTHTFFKPIANIL